MKRIIYTAFLMFVLTVSPFSGVQAVEQGSDKEQSFIKDDKGFSFEIAEDEKEEVALKLFVKNTASEHEIYDISADDLNRINPAAGIKIQFGF